MDSLRPRSHMGETSSQNDSIVPAGTDISFCVLSQHFVLGYFHKVPTGHTEARQAPAGTIDAIVFCLSCHLAGRKCKPGRLVLCACLHSLSLKDVAYLGFC
jgi:hypothetical protein